MHRVRALGPLRQAVNTMYDFINSKKPRSMPETIIKQGIRRTRSPNLVAILRPPLPVLPFPGGRTQRSVENLKHIINKNKLQIVENFLRKIDKIAFICRRQDHRFDTSTAGREQLFFDSADRQHVATKCYLARHRDRMTHGPLCKDRDERRRHSYAGGRTVFRDGAFRKVNVYVVVVENVLFDAKLRKTALCECERSLCGFLHNVAELACKLEFSFPAYPQRLDHQDLASGRRPRKARDSSDRIPFGSLLDMYLRHEQEILHVVGRDLDRLDLPLGFGLFACDLAAD